MLRFCAVIGASLTDAETAAELKRSRAAKAAAEAEAFTLQFAAQFG
jgi:hypothetical protein